MLSLLFLQTFIYNAIYPQHTGSFSTFPLSHRHKPEKHTNFLHAALPRIKQDTVVFRRVHRSQPKSEADMGRAILLHCQPIRQRTPEHKSSACLPEGALTCDAYHFQAQSLSCFPWLESITVLAELLLKYKVTVVDTCRVEVVKMSSRTCIHTHNYTQPHKLYVACSSILYDNHHNWSTIMQFLQILDTRCLFVIEIHIQR